MSNPHDHPDAPDAQTTQREDAKPPIIVIDIRKSQSAKRIKRLRKGRGKLMSKIEMMLDEMTEQGVIEGSAQPVVVVVRETDASAKFG